MGHLFCFYQSRQRQFGPGTNNASTISCATEMIGASQLRQHGPEASN